MGVTVLERRGDLKLDLIGNFKVIKGTLNDNLLVYSQVNNH